MLETITADLLNDIKGFQRSDIPENGIRSVDVRDETGLLFSISISANGVAYAVYKRGEELNLTVSTRDEV